jgi:hypothetical protein
MSIPMLVVVHGNPLFNNDDFLMRWEQTVTVMLQSGAAEVIRIAKAQVKLMESWLAQLPDERQLFVSLKLPQCHFDICLCLQSHDALGHGDAPVSI